MELLWLVALSSISVVFGSSDDRPTVDSPSGTYRGHLLKTRNDRDVLAFQGIPYALPPTGQLRFKDPVKMPKLEGIFEANNDSIQCFQPSLDFTQVKNISSYSGHEDCLFLNVYRPKRNEKEAMPVLVWIHGGAFVMGSRTTFWGGPKYLLDKDIVLVTMNYRLGILGFLSTGDNVISGNLGLKDQVMALKWVKDNIAAFGGDPNLITVGGVSAGGASASLHMHSPLSKGLFQRAIAESGTAHCSFSTKSYQVAKADSKKVAKYLGCSTESQQLLNCLQRMPLLELFQAATIPFIPSNVAVSLDFIPVLENDASSGTFITKKSFDEPSDVPLIAGVASHECMYFLNGFVTASSKYMGNVALLFEDLDNVLPFWAYYKGHPHEKEITEQIVKHYVGQNGFDDSSEVKLIDVFSDVMFDHGLHLTGKLEKGPTYLYKFSYRGATPYPNMSPPKGLEDGVSHGEETVYLFDIAFLQRDSNWTKEDLDMSNQLVDIWYNFIKTGDPTPESKSWEQSDGGVKYLDITNQGLHMKSNMFQSRMEFLDKLNIDRSLIFEKNNESPNSVL